MTKKAFLICPVKGHSPEETRPFVEALEEAGWQVHWPPRDTDQTLSGLEICRQNRMGIALADWIFIVYDVTSLGSHFDLGMAFAFRKPLTVLGGADLEDPVKFARMITDWAAQRGGD